MDINDAGSVRAALDRYRPWAVVNAAGFAALGRAEQDAFLCLCENTVGSGVLGAACDDRGIRRAVFSSSLVYEGSRGTASRIESRSRQSSRTYGRSTIAMEDRVLRRAQDALIVRSGPRFGPWDDRNFVTRALRGVAAGEDVLAPTDAYLSPVYLPDFSNVVLDLLIDGEDGVRHVVHAGTEGSDV